MTVFERLFTRLTYIICDGVLGFVRADPTQIGPNSASSLVTIAIQHRSVDPSIDVLPFEGDLASMRTFKSNQNG